MSFFLFLASASPRRAQLLEQIEVNYQVFPQDIDETFHTNENVINFVQRLAKEKAEQGRKTIARNTDQPVLGADTIVTLEQHVLGKPKDIIEAKNMLQKLSGKKHQVHTAICLINRSLDLQKKETFTSYVTFRELNEQIIESYFSIVDPLDKAGAYAMQTKPEMLIKSFEGSRNNIIGLPIEKLAKWFMKFRIN